MNTPASAGVRTRGRCGYGASRRDLICRQGMLEQTFDRCRPAGFAEQVYEGAQRDRHLPMAGIIKKEPLEAGRPVLEHANQLPRAQERVGHGFVRIRDTQPFVRRFWTIRFTRTSLLSPISGDLWKTTFL